MIRILLAALLALVATACAQADEPYAKLGGITLTKYVSAPGYSEGPTWWNGDVVFCSGALLRARPDGGVDRFLDVNPAGTVLRGDGHLLICDNRHKALLALSPAGELSLLADAFEGQPLNSLNDLTIDAVGNIYWSDPAGSSKDQPVGKVFRLRPDGTVSKAAEGLAFPNGLDVDPAGKFLYVIESQTQKILRYALLPDDRPLGKPELFYDLGGSGGDGCAFDAQGNLWTADFHRPDTKRGRITVLSPEAKVLGAIEVPAGVVSNIAFGGPNRDEIFCTTGNPPGLFHAHVGIKGFAGHPGKPGKAVKTIPVSPSDGASPVSPRRFAAPGGVAQIRGWYLWKKWDPMTGEAQVTKDPPGEIYTVRILPWSTTYRRLAYGGSPGDLLEGERVNLFFHPDERHPRGFLVHFQDELCQMHGHKHVWEIRSVDGEGKGFTARVLADGKPFEAEEREFRIDAGCESWKEGRVVEQPSLKTGDQVYLTWCQPEKERVVKLIADAASLAAVKEREEQRLAERTARDGIEGKVESVDETTVHFLAFARSWSQCGDLKPGQKVLIQRAAQADKPDKPVPATIVSRKNLGQYGSGPTEIPLKIDDSVQAETVGTWTRDVLVRLVPVTSRP